ncbi:MAG: histidinol-phosphate transaminase [Ignavibacteriales bacterium]|nr:histidinol-phosphate transaminase [Ignavibacteriales bacterium]
MKIENLVRKNILELKPYTAARHSHFEGILLDANENPFGAVIENGGLHLNRYPDPYQTEIRKALSKYLNVHLDKLFFGVGSDEIIDLLIRIFCEPREDNVIICEPTYGMYKVCCDINNVEVKSVPLNSSYNLDYEKIVAAINNKTKIIFVCSPNNPTSNLLDKNIIIKIARENNVIVAVDEAYADFAGDSSLINDITDVPNIVLMRTFSKAWGLAAIRCGYCISSEEIIRLLFKVKFPYNMNALTANAVLKALSNVEKKNDYVQIILSERERVYNKLLGYKKIINVIKSDSNFISFRVEKPKEVFSSLEKSGIIIRDRSNQLNFGGYLRVTIGTTEENELFLSKLEEVL